MWCQRLAPVSALPPQPGSPAQLERACGPREGKRALESMLQVGFALQSPLVSVSGLTLRGQVWPCCPSPCTGHEGAATMTQLPLRVAVWPPQPVPMLLAPI